MALTTYSFSRYFSATGPVARHGIFVLVSIGLVHLTAIAIMAFTETTFVSKLAFLLTWGIVNFFWLALFRRPAVAAALSLIFVALLITLSEFKYQVLFMTLNFVDLMIIDPDTVAYAFTIFPSLGWTVAAIAAVLISLLALIWRFDAMRVRLRYALAGFAACFIGIVTLSLWWEMETYETFYGNNYVSTFSRTGVAAISELMTHGMLEAD